ncbi:MAG: gluconate 2-dehydrogenase subunit 3 family protein [Sulfurimonas sp.]
MISHLSSRRTFLKAGFLSSAVFVMSGCELFSVTTSQNTIKVLQRDLFPKAQELGINTSSYISIILHHSRVSEEDKAFIKNGVKWLNEEAVKMYKETYVKLLSTHRQEVLREIVKTEWGESFMYNMNSYLFEAMLGDPIYGGNDKEAGWKWLGFTGGQPRPKEMYL